ncbi:MAG: MaoC family dehydratase N-terminal domain-containing protein [Desulfarculus sp.]|nr:MaoC family dehydratase N-terminal domain-containing protein [Pseudomonadota bacterium]MBV1718153.1 MaoC family dehydratase N-terminal domain-containing protein [Desulfarculus sp.]MBU4576719.1 MaoC family dehydratase N-terminal domain-containing protein [Pseudomonadota bacterium]MBU4598647.1 MaoC family dehydratase N-terminal domain-containing protein [Pseudomonadota bacterium]MBV1738761.1 MaoC family dehydratase N-terminal domain-containing protein [Desulfarculus sp.]
MSRPDISQIIERGLAKYRERMEGAVLRAPVSQRVATPEAIRQFAQGLGDLNPLWCDPDYAASTEWGGLLAPPAFLNAVCEGQAILGLPGLIAFFVGARWEWNGVMRAGDSFTVDNELLPLADKTEPGQPVRVFQQGVLRYRNQRGEVAGSCRWDMMRSQVKLGGGKKKEPSGEAAPAALQREPYSSEKLAEVYEAIRAEKPRGREERFWRDVAVGDEVAPVIKGPLSLSDMVAWSTGIAWHRAALAHGPKLMHLLDNPGLAYIDPASGAPEPIAMSHMDPDGARILMGSPLPMDIGFQRVAWFTHPVTDWMGDAGRLLSLEVRLSGFVRFGDIAWLGGKVASKERLDGRAVVNLDLQCTNQRGEEVAAGTAQVALPESAA